MRILTLVLLLDVFALFYGASTLSISFYEARDFFDPLSVSSALAKLGVNIFGPSGLRFFFIILHLLSALLMYSLALKYFDKSKDALACVILFILLPGTVASALIINPAGIVIFISLLIVNLYYYKKTTFFYAFIILAVFIDKSFIILYLSLFFYAFYKKNALLLMSSFLLFSLSMYFYGFDTGGRPQNYLLDTLGIFAACFSPLVFLYFFYVVYKLSFFKEKSLLFFIMATTFIFCLLLSLRQKLYLDDFLPFCVISVPLIYQNFINSYRVRLPKFRLKYKLLAGSAFLCLLASYLIIVFNTYLYFFIDRPDKHFAYNYHLVAPLAKELKAAGIKAVNTQSDLALRLRFYGILQAAKPTLYESNEKNAEFKVKFGNMYEYFALLP